MTEAIQSLPMLSEDYILLPEQISEYQQNGHILLKGVCNAGEIQAYEPIIKAAVDRYNTELRPLTERDTYAMAFLQIMNLWVRDEVIKRYTLARRFARIAAQLMGVKGVRIYHDQALFKEPGGGITPWHQDEYYWPLDTDNTLTMWMPLVDATPDMGTLVFASGSQVTGYLGKLPISDESEAIFKRFVAEKGFHLVPGASMAAGDATFHSGWTMHTAPGNQSSICREVMTVIYIADGARVTQPDNRHREDDLKNWLTGCKPGDLAASPLNPLVYSG